MVTKVGKFTLEQSAHGAHISVEGFEVSPTEDCDWDPEKKDPEILKVASRLAINEFIIMVLSEANNKSTGHGSDFVDEVRDGKSEIQIKREQQ